MAGLGRMERAMSGGRAVSEWTGLDGGTGWAASQHRCEFAFLKCCSLVAVTVTVTVAGGMAGVWWRAGISTPSMPHQRGPT